MEIRQPNENTIEIIGNVKTIDDYEQIRHIIDSMVNYGIKDIHFKLLNSFSLTSSVIGYLIKIINLENVTLTTYVSDERLMKLLNSLNLKALFNVRQI